MLAEHSRYNFCFTDDAMPQVWRQLGHLVMRLWSEVVVSLILISPPGARRKAFELLKSRCPGGREGMSAHVLRPRTSRFLRQRSEQYFTLAQSLDHLRRQANGRLQTMQDFVGS